MNRFSTATAVCLLICALSCGTGPAPIPDPPPPPAGTFSGFWDCTESDNVEVVPLVFACAAEPDVSACFENLAAQGAGRARLICAARDVQSSAYVEINRGTASPRADRASAAPAGLALHHQRHAEGHAMSTNAVLSRIHADIEDASREVAPVSSAANVDRTEFLMNRAQLADFARRSFRLAVSRLPEGSL